MSSFMNADLGSDSDSDDGDFDPTKERHEGNTNYEKYFCFLSLVN